MKTNVNKLKILAFSIGLVFLYFGILKFFPQTSPAETIGINTVSKLCCGILPEQACLISLAILEVGIGLGLLFGKFLRVVIPVAITHLILTFTPALFFPEEVFTQSFFTPSLLGQYIFKNIVLISALIVIYPARPNLQLQSN